ncbi:hypothetical protein [Leifsonia virtsii]|uniref:Terminase n=1 Tax=Leifsonia virtsii TaxID=3035915 RepID=A0ABT8J1L6_9MICO|nr:hypothetical protein [Leifsonia virtsii]MDN4598852.1 hypothetical protein [Leifsonia virtsii]
MGYELEDYDPERRLRELTDPEFAGAERARRRKAGYRDQLLPQQLVISDALDTGHDEYVIEIMRRASKTTSIFMKLLGRSANRPGRQTTFSAQNGVAGSRRLREWGARLDDMNPPDDLDLPPWLRGRQRVDKRQQRAVALFGDDWLPDAAERPGGRGFRIMRGEVGKGIYFDNGSTFLVLKPDPDAYRGEGADDSWFDEFQEVDPDEGAEVMAGVLPLQDTKIGASTIVSGTAGETRVGPFWSMLQRLREDDPTMGGLDYAFPYDVQWDEIEDEETAMRLLQENHPGIGTLTIEPKMRKNYRALPKPQWAREYGSVWPETAGERVITAQAWADAEAKRWPAQPKRVAFGMAIKPGGSAAAICAAWRDSRGTAYIEVVKHAPGTTWLPEEAQAITRARVGSTIAYDDISEGKATATEMQPMRPRPRLRVQTYRETAAGCVQIMRDLARGKLKHNNDPSLNAAVAVATKREVRNDKGVWLWTISDLADDITTLDAATKALRNWDQHFATKTAGGNNSPIMGN